MAEIVNLRQVRKRKARSEKQTQAAANRLKFGRTKADTAKQHLENAKLHQDLDGKKRED